MIIITFYVIIPLMNTNLFKQKEEKTPIIRAKKLTFSLRLESLESCVGEKVQEPSRYVNRKMIIFCASGFNFLVELVERRGILLMLRIN